MVIAESAWIGGVPADVLDRSAEPLRRFAEAIRSESADVAIVLQLAAPVPGALTAVRS